MTVSSGTVCPAVVSAAAMILTVDNRQLQWWCEPDNPDGGCVCACVERGWQVQRKREAVAAVYELKPMADAKKVPGTEGNSWNMGV